VSQARRWLAGHSGQTGATHQHSWLVVHCCRGLERRDEPYHINQTPAQSPVPLLDFAVVMRPWCFGAPALWTVGDSPGWLALPGRDWFTSEQC
jgi:hypothetical protein